MGCYAYIPKDRFHTFSYPPETSQHVIANDSKSRQKEVSWKVMALGQNQTPAFAYRNPRTNRKEKAVGQVLVKAREFGVHAKPPFYNILSPLAPSLYAHDRASALPFPHFLPFHPPQKIIAMREAHRQEAVVMGRKHIISIRATLWREEASGG